MAYARGKYAQAISDRSGMAFPYNEMVREWNGMFVHKSEYEAKQPQLQPRPHGGDAQGLQNIRSDRGTNTITAEFNQVVTLTTIVDDLIVEKVSKTIEEAAYTGNNSDGIIVISNIESVLNIASKKKNSEGI